MVDSEEALAFARVLGDARSFIIVNWTQHEVNYDASLVEGLELLIGSLGSAKPGVLRPLEATVWGLGARASRRPSILKAQGTDCGAIAYSRCNVAGAFLRIPHLTSTCV